MTSRRLLLTSAVLLAAVLTAAAAGSSPGHCVPGQGIPLSPLPACCRQLEAVPAECRCRALRVMAEETPPAVVGRACWVALAQFAPAVVAEAECGLRTVHGIRFCYALRADGWPTEMRVYVLPVSVEQIKGTAYSSWLCVFS
ncbi:hypothetical protein SEVIR_2G087700v4 [Setaria viridis]|uniref:Bifunctional inhibitor/plant lipid transfer protein/seed storage helical domain-containing protein n=2 Tax=Setaria viridis TaxID=4556 RepID=A0A4V6DAV5_SETVI|nr:alpha-amylase inhibitor 5-like [Setaria viridis]TKW31176.1 hypothetical protein SEVIR_2G087700v2 [Setaria viridis]